MDPISPNAFCWEMWDTTTVCVEIRHFPTSRTKDARDPDFLHAALVMAACAAFCKESRMKFVYSTKYPRKSWGYGAPNDLFAVKIPQS
jgi:hypothetical protein